MQHTLCGLKIRYDCLADRYWEGLVNLTLLPLQAEPFNPVLSMLPFKVYRYKYICIRLFRILSGSQYQTIFAQMLREQGIHLQSSLQASQLIKVRDWRTSQLVP